MHERDRQTDGRDGRTDTGPEQRPRLRIASRGKNSYLNSWLAENREVTVHFGEIKSQYNKISKYAPRRQRKKSSMGKMCSKVVGLDTFATHKGQKVDEQKRYINLPLSAW